MDAIDKFKWTQLSEHVVTWAKENASNDYWYGSPCSYWTAALNAGIITQSEYDFGKKISGKLWDYRGD